MIIHTDTVRYIAEVLEGGEYDFLFKDLVVVDVGCNIGTFSLWILPQAKQIYAVDESTEHTNLFQRTVRDNGYTNIKVTNARISGMDEEGVVPTYSLCGYLDSVGVKSVDVLKLDVEGAELDIIWAPDFPTQRIQTIIGEHHYDEHKAKKFKDRLVDLGYRYYEYPGSHFKAVRI